MTALEQQLIQELQQEKALNTEIITRLETQETKFLTALEKVVEEFKTHLENDKKELENLHTEQSNLHKEMLSINKLIANLPSYEDLEKDLKTLLVLQKN